MMLRLHECLCMRMVLFLVCMCGSASLADAQISALAQSDTDKQAEEKTDGWVDRYDEQSGVRMRTWELAVHPRGEPLPALKYRFLVDAYERLDGNAAIFYLKAMGFLEQNPARQRLDQIAQEASRQAKEEDRDYDQVPPEVWRWMAPTELPVEEVKKHLQLTAFQQPWLAEAARRDRYDMDRNMRDVDDPIGYLLPEIQNMRSLARTQDLRCRLAMAEGRVDDAIAILGQQWAMARHLGQDDFIVSNLVGMACAGMAFPQALHLAAHPESPNLYWAYASLPRPLVETRRAMGFERRLLFEQVKALREIDEQPRSVDYWSDFVDRLAAEIGFFGREMRPPLNTDSPQQTRAVLVAFVGASYPAARDYLIEQWAMPREQVESYPMAQVVFLAVVRFYEQWRDDTFKWVDMPYWQVRTNPQWREFDKNFSAAAVDAGFCSIPATFLLPAILSVQAAEARCGEHIAMLQTIEAIRLYGASHDGTLPASLDDLPVPAPQNPATGQPIDYQLLAGRAVLTGAAYPGIQYRLVVRFAGK